MLAVALLAAAPLLLERIPLGTEAVEVSIARDCGPGGCALLLRSGASQLDIDDLALPAGSVERQEGQWVLAGAVTLSLRPLQLGERAFGLLVQTLRVPEGKGASLGAFRVATLSGGALRLPASFADREEARGLGQVALADGVLHFIHDAQGGEAAPDEFDDTAWDWSSGHLRPLPGATLFALVVAAVPSLAQARGMQRQVQSKCPEAGVLRSYASSRFESLPQAFFAGRIFLRRAEAEAALDKARRCAATAGIIETAFLAN